MKAWSMKKIFYFFVFLIVYLIFFIEVFPFILSKSSDIFSGNKYVLLVGDFVNDDSFGKNVLNGFITAVNKKGKNKLPFDYSTINVDERLVENISGSISLETKDVHKHLNEELVKQISEKNVICIISANNSQTLQPCLDIGKTFNIPVLITVASTKISDDYKDISFRLLADNSKQAKIIVDWMHSTCDSNKSYFGTLYSPTIYGNNLLKEIRKFEGFERIIPFTINTTTDLVGTIKYGYEIGICGWISLSYQKESIEIQVKKEKISPNKQILFSDGAYGEWINAVHQNKEDNLFLSFPETYPSKQNRIDSVYGFGVFGYDAFWIIDYCLSEKNGFDKRGFIEKIRDFENSNNIELVQKYKFINGENKYSKYKVYKIYDDVP